MGKSFCFNSNKCYVYIHAAHNIFNGSNVPVGNDYFYCMYGKWQNSCEIYSGNGMALNIPNKVLNFRDIK